MKTALKPLDQMQSQAKRFDGSRKLIVKMKFKLWLTALISPRPSSFSCFSTIACPQIAGEVFSRKEDWKCSILVHQQNAIVVSFWSQRNCDKSQRPDGSDIRCRMTKWQYWRPKKLKLMWIRTNGEKSMKFVILSEFCFRKKSRKIFQKCLPKVIKT